MIALVLIAIGIIIACTVLLINEIRNHLAKTRSTQERGPLAAPSKGDANKWSGRIWVISLTVVCLGIIAYGYFYPELRTGTLGYHVGGAVGNGLIIWTIFNVTLGRNHGYKKAALSLVLICSASRLSASIGLWQEEGATRRMNAASLQLATELVNNTQASPRDTEQQADTASTARGEIGEMERFSRNFLNRVASLRQAYERELQASGIERILDPERLKRDVTLFESKMIVKTAKETTAKYRIRAYDLVESVGKDIGNLRVNEHYRRDFARGANDSWHSNGKIVWDLELEMVSEFENIVALLSRTRGAWTVEDGQIVFADDSDLNAYNSLLDAINESVIKQDELIKQAMKALENGVSED